MVHTLANIQCADTTVWYVTDEKHQRVGLWMYPTAMQGKLTQRRARLGGPEMAGLPGGALPAWGVEPLVQLKRLEDAYPSGFSAGRTMRNADFQWGLAYQSQTVREEAGGQRVLTVLAHPAGYACHHELWWKAADRAVRVRTRFENRSDKPITLEMLASFSLGGITPFADNDAPGRLWVHRFRSSWSAEGRHVAEPIEQLQLERSWSGHAVACERFGQVGTMPVRGFFPWLAVEDREIGVFWAAQLAWPGSWQMELYRRDDLLNISGGLADREFGHWTRTVAPGEIFTTPTAFLATSAEGFDDLCERLTALQEPAADAAPSVEADLPIGFNEYCTTWGTPTHDKIVAIAQRLRELPVKYFVIDAGWYVDEPHGTGGDWGSALGEWHVNTHRFPQGLQATAAALRNLGFTPGIWFEWEALGPAAARRHPEHVLKRDGQPLNVGGRYFWDLCDDWVIRHLDERVLGLLERCGFGYLKVDYNETVGIGCDGAESLGEGLRQRTEAMRRYFQHIRQRLPALVIENCSSGGHRLEPSMQSLASLGSSSDAHETVEIPIIAANLHRLILPRQSLIWAVLRKGDSQRRLIYSLAATFLGRMCLSGDILELDERQWTTLQRACNLYRHVWPVIKHGSSRRYGPTITSYRHPRGWQAVVRTGNDDATLLVIVHSFGGPQPQHVGVPLPPGDWQVAQELCEGTAASLANGRAAVIPPDGQFSGRVVVLRKNPPRSVTPIIPP